MLDVGNMEENMAVVEVVTCNAGPDIFAWKHPNSELGTWTQLIVNESQEAILFKGGIACDVFGAGRHVLDTKNIPILSKLVNLPFGGRSPFTAEVWFVNKVFSLDIKWGTSTPIQLQDPKYKVFVPVRAFGQFGIQIEDSKKFVMKLVGTLPVFDKASIIKYFRGVYLTKAKDAISSYLIHKSISVLEINAYLDEISTYLKEKIAPHFEEFGIALSSFYVNDINVPEDDSAVIQLKKALAKRAEMDIVGYSYQQERSFDTLEGAATNPGSAQSAFMGAGMGLGMGVGMGNVMGAQFGGVAQNLNVTTKQCPKCHANIDANVRFCSSCGADTQKAVDSDVKEIVCSSCSAKLSKNSKFCPECGKKYNPCAKCGSDMPENASVCPSCGAKAPKKCPRCQALVTGKFCPECGYSMVVICSGCGKQLDDNVKFCPECGTLVK